MSTKTKNGISKGYASGSLTYTADWWNGASNDGEFSVEGTSFTPNALITIRRYYYAGAASGWLCGRALAAGARGFKILLGDHDRAKHDERSTASFRR